MSAEERGRGSRHAGLRCPPAASRPSRRALAVSIPAVAADRRPGRLDDSEGHRVPWSARTKRG
ncbi:hypothetical protein EYF80_038796 [Liparis tanakae]|uniref:Uncharacterized protein n=1 Tax=Liparis tanakae TaxID=230148 RepID=A0A4Z2GE48_9TELE|nr:hypothetical protein EYF80_038796 [Liparis tanakae]